MLVLLVAGQSGGSSHILSLLYKNDNKDPNGHAEENLDSSQYEIISSSRETALSVYKTKHPDLVLIDLELGKSESQSLSSQIRDLEGHRHTGVVFFSSKDEHDSTSVECLEHGADDFIRFSCSEREVLARVNAVLRLKAMTDELRSANHKLHQLSLTDELTGLKNMRAFNGLYSKAIKECKNGASPICVIMLDLDHFKNVNDSTNHLMGSHVIREIGNLLKNATILCADDCSARYGGDEYIILTKDPTLEIANRKAEGIRKLVKSGIFVKDGKSVRITTSVGVAWVPPGYQGKAEDPIKAADMMLYQSKEKGRNRVSSIILQKPEDIEAQSKLQFVDLQQDNNESDEQEEEQNKKLLYYL